MYVVYVLFFIFIFYFLFVCLDIDECVYFPKICGKGKCVNEIGSYRCDCDEGFEQATVNYIRKCAGE